MRQRPKPPWSLVHRWRYGAPVFGLIAVPLNTIPPPGEVTPVANGAGSCALAAGAAMPAKITRLIQNLEARLAIKLSHGLRTVVIVPSVVPVKSIIVVVILCCPEAA
jgi:hypothetical protein